MQNYPTKNHVIDNLVMWVITCLMSLCFIYKKRLFVLDSIIYNNNTYYARFLYTAKRQIFMKTIKDVYENKELLKKFNASDVALISYLFTRGAYEKFRINAG